MRKPLVLVAVPVLVAALAIPALAATKSVRVGDNWFVRDTESTPTVTVKRNDYVRWRFVGDRAHTVTVRRGPVRFDSGEKRSGVFRKRMTRTGTYRIYCRIHGADDQSMILRVRR